jgi:conjugative transfer signal peptidase TraF
MTDRPRLLFATSGAVLLLSLPALMQPAPHLVWNASKSSPIGLYRVEPERLPVPGEWVVLRTPERVRMLAARRHYIPANVLLVKRVAAGAGQSVCAAGATLTIDGVPAASRRPVDPSGRPLPRWRGCRLLGRDELFVLGSAPDSFDGRYFGPVGPSERIGKAVPLWLR